MCNYNPTDKKSSYEDYLDKNSPQEIIDLLKPYITEQRKQRINLTLSNRLEDIHLAMESTADMHNALAAVRSSEAMGIIHIHFISPEGDAKTIRGVTQGAHHWLRLHFYRDISDFVKKMQQQKIQLAGATVDAKKSLGDIEVDNRAICLLLGNEQRGLSKTACDACDILYKIPMYGMTESYNLSVSAAISLYDTTQRKRKIIKGTGNITAATFTDLTARYYCHTLKNKLVDGLLK